MTWLGKLLGLGKTPPPAPGTAIAAHLANTKGGRTASTLQGYALAEAMGLTRPPDK